MSKKYRVKYHETPTTATPHTSVTQSSHADTLYASRSRPPATWNTRTLGTSP